MPLIVFVSNPHYPVQKGGISEMINFDSSPFLKKQFSFTILFTWYLIVSAFSFIYSAPNNRALEGELDY